VVYLPLFGVLVRRRWNIFGRSHLVKRVTSAARSARGVHASGAAVVAAGLRRPDLARRRSGPLATHPRQAPRAATRTHGVGAAFTAGVKLEIIGCWLCSVSMYRWQPVQRARGRRCPTPTPRVWVTSAQPSSCAAVLNHRDVILPDACEGGHVHLRQCTVKIITEAGSQYLCLVVG